MNKISIIRWTRSLRVPAERIEQSILLIRGHKVMLDKDLAVLYGVTTFNLNKAVKRNLRACFITDITTHRIVNVMLQFRGHHTELLS